MASDYGAQLVGWQGKYRQRWEVVEQTGPELSSESGDLNVPGLSPYLLNKASITY